MAKSIPTLYREWQVHRAAADTSDKRWRIALARAKPGAGDLHAKKREHEKAQDAAAKALANACLDSRGRWRWDGEHAPVDLLRGSKR